MKLGRRSVLAAPALLLPKYGNARNGLYAPFNATLVIAGDSVVQALATISPPPASPINWYNTFTCQSDWANVLGGSRFRVPQGGNRAVGGQTIATIDANFTSDLAQFSPNIIYANGGPTDIQDSDASAAQILSHWTSIASQAAAMGAFLIIQPIYDNSVYNGNSTMETIRLAVNAGLVTLAGANPGKIALVDITGFNYLNDCYTQTNVGAGSMVHPNVIGARLLATSMISIINGVVPPGTILQTASDPKNLFPNGYLTGTDGTLVDATGTVAAGFTLDNSNSGGATVVASITSNPAGGNWQNVAVSGSYTGAAGYVLASSQNALTGVAANKEVELTLALQLDTGSSYIDGFTVSVLLFDATFTYSTESSLFSDNITDGIGGFNVAQFTGIARVMPCSMSQAAPAYALITVQANLRANGSGQPVSGTFRFGQIGIRAL
jgi:hypothetical protein